MPLLRNGYPGVLEVRLLPRNRVPRFPPTHLYDEVGAPILYSCCGPLGVSAHHRHPDPTLAVYRAESGGANRILKEAKSSQEWCMKFVLVEFCRQLAS